MADPPVLVVGLGNELRHDDGAGIEVARRLGRSAGSAGIEVREHQGEPSQLLDAMHGRHAVVFVDAMRVDAPAGAIRRFDASARALPDAAIGSTSTHAFALSETIELARALDRLPPRVIVFGIAGRMFDAGSGLSDEVRDAIGPLVDMVWGDAAGLAHPGVQD